MEKYDMPLVASSGYMAQVDTGVCEACGACEKICPFEAITVTTAAVVSWEGCMGCGVCVGQCPNSALTLVRDEGKPMPLDVRMLADKQAAN